ncbi:GATA-binding factor 2 [Datura stramonium]|uniref:GATA-binding factor 2 n=1 Tax=Datura stramonium TaxID=4076 RepID=A0ABS8VBH1_DATST|nr:GATA-binding factor 2 [Datura stramonium]
MDVYGVSAPDLFRIDDLLDFSNDEIFSINTNSSNTTTPDSHRTHQLTPTTPPLPPPPLPAITTTLFFLIPPTTSRTTSPSRQKANVLVLLPAGHPRSKTLTLLLKNKGEAEHTRERSSSMDEDVPRRCTHCASEKTPQWRTGPLGPKTLCNACGVRYKSGRLVPEYRRGEPSFCVNTAFKFSPESYEPSTEGNAPSIAATTTTAAGEEGMYGHHFRVC